MKGRKHVCIFVKRFLRGPDGPYVAWLCTCGEVGYPVDEAKLERLRKRVA